MHHSRWVVGLAVLAACGGTTAKAPPPRTASFESAPLEAPRPAVHKRGGQKLIAEVGQAGGTLELDNGARLEIPAGALPGEVELTFAAGARTTAFANHEYERPLGPTLEIAPELALAAPIKVSVPMTGMPEGFEEQDLALGLEVVSATQRAVQGQGVQTRWDYMPASSTSGRASAELSQVPGYRLQFVLSKNE